MCNPNPTFSWTVSGGANITGASAGNGIQINQTIGGLDLGDRVRVLSLGKAAEVVAYILSYHEAP